MHCRELGTRNTCNTPWTFKSLLFKRGIYLFGQLNLIPQCLKKHIFDCYIFFFISGINCDEHEYRLTKYLLSNYESTVRPVKNSSEPIEVKYYFISNFIFISMCVDESKLCQGLPFCGNNQNDLKYCNATLWNQTSTTKWTPLWVNFLSKALTLII